MEEIQIIDDFFTIGDVMKIKKHIELLDWKNEKKNKINLLKINKNEDHPYWNIPLTENNFFSIYLKQIIETKLKSNIKLLRIFILCQTYLQNGNYHYDSELPGKFTFCYYINENFEDGYFYIKIPNQIETVCIAPISNRGILFPSHYKHKGDGYIQRDTKLRRMCITFQLG